MDTVKSQDVRGAIPRLARDIRNEMPEVKGFSERNIGRMIAFYLEYPGLIVILPTTLAKLPEPAVSTEVLPTALAKSTLSENVSAKVQQL